MVSVQHDFPSVYAHFVAFFILSQSAAIFKIGIKSLYWEGMAVSQKENTKPAVQRESSSSATHNWITLSDWLKVFCVYFLLSEIRITSALQYAFKNWRTIYEQLRWTQMYIEKYKVLPKCRVVLLSIAWEHSDTRT